VGGAKGYAEEIRMGSLGGGKIDTACQTGQTVAKKKTPWQRNGWAWVFGKLNEERGESKSHHQRQGKDLSKQGN